MNERLSWAVPHSEPNQKKNIPPKFTYSGRICRSAQFFMASFKQRFGLTRKWVCTPQNCHSESTILPSPSIGIFLQNLSWFGIFVKTNTKTRLNIVKDLRPIPRVLVIDILVYRGLTKLPVWRLRLLLCKIQCFKPMIVCFYGRCLEGIGRHNVNMSLYMSLCLSICHVTSF